MGLPPQGLTGDHANWGENYPFTRVGDVPAGSESAVNLELLDEGKTTRDVLGDGSFGGPYQVDDDLMEAMLGVSSPMWSNDCARWVRCKRVPDAEGLIPYLYTYNARLAG